MMNRITREPKGTVRINGVVIEDAKIISAEINPDYTADVLIAVKAGELFFNYTTKEEAAAELDKAKTTTASEYFNDSYRWKVTSSIGREKINR